MNDALGGSSDVLRHMKNGATLHRSHDDKITLTLPDHRQFDVPKEIFDGLLDKGKIAGKTRASRQRSRSYD